MSDHDRLITDGGTWPRTPQGWCDYFHALDKAHDATPTVRGTSGRQIVDIFHHDYRCPIHGTGRIKP